MKTPLYCETLISKSKEGSVDGSIDLSMIDPEQREFQQELQEHNLLQDALQGNNLLGMMIEDKPKFGRQSDGMAAGVDAMDLFIDPMAAFGGEKHPALQEVLKKIDQSKKSRGELQELRKSLQLLVCKAKINKPVK